MNKFFSIIATGSLLTLMAVATHAELKPSNAEREMRHEMAKTQQQPRQ